MALPPEKRRQNLRLAMLIVAVAAALFVAFLLRWRG